MIRAICFDLFETLVTEHGLASPHKDAWATRLGIPPSDFWGAWRSRKDARMSGGDPDFPGTLRAICAELGAPSACPLPRSTQTSSICSIGYVSAASESAW
jgi:hypothetical protein